MPTLNLFPICGALRSVEAALHEMDNNPIAMEYDEILDSIRQMERATEELWIGVQEIELFLDALDAK